MKNYLLLLLAVALPASAQPYLTYNNRPLGSLDAPLVMQSYLPDPAIHGAVFKEHRVGETAPGYNPKEGRDTQKTEKPVAGIPAGIAVSFGPQLAYVFDPVECRPLYAWQGGFLDFSPYWGDPLRGSRVGKDYVPRLVGILFHKAEGKHPLSIDGKSVSDIGTPEYIGYSLEKGVPRYEFQIGKHKVKLIIKPVEKQFSYAAEWTCSPAAKLSWSEAEFSAKGTGKISYTFTGKNLGEFQGYKVKIDLSKANAEAGSTLFNVYGCVGCHSTDNAKGHGPGLGGLAESTREIEGAAEPVHADAAYLLESIKTPNAKIAKGFPPNYMPPFQLPEVEYQSLVLFIQSLGKPE